MNSTGRIPALSGSPLRQWADDPRAQALIVFACLSLLAACALQPSHSPSTQPQVGGSGVGFAGWWLADAEDGGAVVRGMVAGPAAIAGLMRGDRILRIGGVEIDATRAQAMIAASAPGTRLSLEVLRGKTERQVELVVDERDRWSGPASYSAAIAFAATGLGETAHSPDYAVEQALLAEPRAVPV
ncbi:MAG: PDZ domain-containing protein, partial [Burkholderiales bacterium]